MDSNETCNYYSLLGVEKNASPEEIKRAYIKFSKLFHPDRYTKESDRKTAQTRYIQINNAYTVLSNPERKLAYDLKSSNGSKELKVYEGHYDKILQNIKQELNKMKDYCKDISQSMPSGYFKTVLDMRKVFAFRKKYECDSANQDSVSMFQYIPTIFGVRMHQGYKTVVTGSNYILFEGSARVDNGKGKSDGRIMFSYSQTEKLSHNISFLFNNIYKLSYMISYRLSHMLSVRNTLNIGVYKNLPVTIFDSQITSLINPRNELYFRINYSFPPVVTMRWTSRFQKVCFDATITAGPNKSSYASCISYFNITPKTRLKLLLEASLYFIKTGYGIIQNFDPNRSFEFFMSYNTSYGFKLNFIYRHLQQLFKIPIYLSDEYALAPFMYGNLFGIAGFGIVQGVYIALSHMTENKRLKNLKKSASETEAARNRAEYVSYKNLMQSHYENIFNQETAKNGLVIVVALYGKLLKESNYVELEDVDRNVIDVTVQLQCMVERSTLKLPSSSKAVFSGFYDVAPGEKKCLWIRYMFKGSLHEVTCADDEPCSIPKMSHKLNDNANVS